MLSISHSHLGKKIGEFVEWLETRPPAGALLVATGATLLRMHLEGVWCWESPSLRALYLHSGIWFFSVYLYTALLISFFTGTAASRTLTLVFMCSPVILTVPLLHLLLLGTSVCPNYVFLLAPASSDIIELFLLRAKGITTGMRVEWIVICIAMLVYGYLKTKRLPTTLIMVLVWHVSILLLWGALPSWVLWGNLISGATKNVLPSVKGLYGLLAVAFMFLLQLTLCRARAWYRTFLRLFPYERFAHYAITLLIGYFAGVFFAGGVVLRFDQIIYLMAWLLVLFYALVFARIVNDINDVVEDTLNAPWRLLPSGGVSASEYYKVGLLSVGVAGICAGLLSADLLALALTPALFYWLYSAPPLRLKVVPLVSKLCIGMITWIVAVMGWLVAGAPFSSFPYQLSTFLIVGVGVGSHFIELKDIEGDRQAGVRTLAVVLGERKARILFSAFIVLGYVLGIWSALQLGWWPLPLWGAVVLLPAHLWFMLRRKQWQETPVFLLHLVAMFGLLVSVFVSAVVADR